MLKQHEKTNRFM